MKKKLISLILVLCMATTMFQNVLVIAAPINFQVYYNSGVVSNGGSVHYQNTPVTIGIKVSGCTDFYAAFEGTTGSVNLTSDGGDYNEYSFSLPSGPVIITVVADGITLPVQTINFYKDTIIDPGASLSYVSVKAQIQQIGYDPVTRFEVDYDGYTNTGVNKDQLAVEFGKLNYPAGTYQIYGKLQVAVFVNGVLDGYYWADSDTLFTKYNWGTALTNELYQRANWGDTQYVDPKPVVTPTPTATPIPTPTPTPTGTSTPGPTVTLSPTLGPTATPTPTPTPTPKLFTAQITAPAQCQVGQFVNISGSNTSTKPITNHMWNVEGATQISSNGRTESGGFIDNAADACRVVFDTIGTYMISYNVVNSDGVLAAAPEKFIQVIPPKPSASIQVSGDLKENRRISLSGTGSTGTTNYPISSYLWQVTYVATGSSTEVKKEGSFNTSEENLIIKGSGQYKVTLAVKNTAGVSDTTETIITVIPDSPPIASFSAATPEYRNPADANNALINIYDTSYSNDGDYISSRVWKYAYDSNNDGDFADEAWATFSTGNSTNVQLKPNQVGKYKIREEITEGFGQPTIPAFISASDYKAAVVENIVEVQNIAPVTSFGVQKKRLVDISVLTDYTGSKLTNLYNSLNTIKSQLIASNVDLNYNVVDGNSKVLVGSFTDSHHIVTPSYGGKYVGIDSNNNFVNGGFPGTGTEVGCLPGNLRGVIYNGSEGQNYAYTKDGKLYGWGTSNYFAAKIPVQVGSSKVINPTLYTDIDNVEDIEETSISLFALKKDGTVWWNGLRSFIYPITSGYVTPFYGDFREIPQLNNVKQIVTTNDQILAVKNDGTVWTSGNNEYYTAAGAPSSYENLGYGNYTVLTNGPQQIPGIDNVDKLFVIGRNVPTVIAIKKDGTVWTWGHYLYELGVAQDGYKYLQDTSEYATYFYCVYTPKQVPNLNGNEIAQIALTNSFGYTFVKKDGTLWTLKPGATLQQITHLYNSRVSYGYDQYWDWVPYQVNDIAMEAKNILQISTFGYYTALQFKDGTAATTYLSESYYEGMIFNLHVSNKITQQFGGMVNIESVNSDLVQNIAPRNGSDRYFICAADGSGGSYSSGFGNYFSLGSLSKNLFKYFANNNYTTYATTQTSNYDYISPFGKQELTIRNLINGNVNIGGLYDVGQYQQILDNIKAKYAGNLPVTQYALLYDNLIYNTGYSDYEGDAFYDSRWKISHVNPNYFNNSLGVMPNSGVYTAGPVNSFSQVGKYEVVYSARDNPKNDSRFDAYKKWSDENLSKLILYVHRRPTSSFLYALTGRDSWGNVNVTFSDTSFDLDHTSRADRGIKAWEWKYRDADSANWTIGQPSVIPKGRTYVVSLRVQDLENEWSYPYIQYINSDTLNLTPTVDANPTSWVWTNQNISVTVMADDNGESDFNRVGYTLAAGTMEPGWFEGTMYQKSFPLTYTYEGTWYLHLWVWDNTGNTFYRFRGPYLIDKTLPGGTAIPYSAAWTNQDVPVTFSPWDALSGVKQWRYRTSDNNGVSYGPWSGYSWGEAASYINFNYQGIHMLQAEVIDNAGNLSYISSGPYLIDKVAPVITTNPSQVYEQAGPIEVVALVNDNLSGVKETKYFWSQYIDKPESGWADAGITGFSTILNQEGEWYLHVEAWDNAGNSSYIMPGKFTVTNLKLYDFTVTLINEATWRDYYFDGVDSDGDGEKDVFSRKTGTDIKTTKMPVNDDNGERLINYERDGIDAGCKVSFYVKSKGSPQKVVFTASYLTEKGLEYAMINPISSSGETWSFEWIVPLACKEGSFISFSVEAVKDGTLYGNEYWVDSWISGNDNHKVFFITGNVLKRLKFNQSW